MRLPQRSLSIANDSRCNTDWYACCYLGDEVVEWNGIRLRGLTFEEVYDIIFESKFDPQVELTVYRPVGNAQQPRRDDPQCLANTEGLLLSSQQRFYHCNNSDSCLLQC